MICAEDFDMDGIYSVDSFPGIAFRPDGWVEIEVYPAYDGEWWYDDEIEVIPDTSGKSGVYMVMIGDDRKWIIHLDELNLIDDNICSCGQIGCGWG